MAETESKPYELNQKEEEEEDGDGDGDDLPRLGSFFLVSRFLKHRGLDSNSKK